MLLGCYHDSRDTAINLKQVFLGYQGSTVRKDEGYRMVPEVPCIHAVDHCSTGTHNEAMKQTTLPRPSAHS